MQANSVMKIECLRKIIEEFCCIRLKIKKDGTYYKHVIHIGKRNKIIWTENWFPITVAQRCRGTIPLCNILASHNHFCNCSQRLENIWLYCKLFLERNKIILSPNHLPLLEKFKSLVDILQRSSRLYEEFKTSMEEIVDYEYDLFP